MENATFNQTDVVSASMDCAEVQEGILASFSFWIEGITQVSIAMIGIFFNLVSMVILMDKEMRNSFNFMLIGLSFFDTWYLFGSILESFRIAFDLETNLHIQLFPYFLYPGQMIVMMCSVYMTVAIAIERFSAVRYPLIYNQSMNDVWVSVKRVLKFVIPVTLGSIVFNIPKFFEAGVIYTNLSNNITVADLEVKSIRKDPNYIKYYNITARVLVNGIIPFLLLIYFNIMIYRDVKFRRTRRQARLRHQSTNLNDNSNGAVNISMVSNNMVTDHRPNSHVTLSRNNGRAIVLNQMNNGDDSNRPNNRTLDEHLAIVFGGIVCAFFICHFPRMVLSIHEMATIEHRLECTKHGHWGFPLWALILTKISHLLLVINSSINCLIYGLISPKFRKTAYWKAKKWGCLGNICFKAADVNEFETPPEAGGILLESAHNDNQVQDDVV